MKAIKLNNITVNNDAPLVVIAGPCQLEDRTHGEMIAQEMADICAKAGAGYVFKASFDKANRTSVDGKRGMGIERGLEALAAIKKNVNVPILTDIHSPEQCALVAEVADILQIPAFLCRQTDLLLAAGQTGKIVNIKKGQFLAPWDMLNVIEKVETTGNEKVILTERGTSFGYNNLVTDMRALAHMMKTGYPVIMDATHSVQQPGGLGASSGGQREFAPLMARAAVSLGIAGVFIETHEEPDRAPSDGANMIALRDMKRLIDELMRFDRLAKEMPLRI